MMDFELTAGNIALAAMFLLSASVALFTGRAFMRRGHPFLAIVVTVSMALATFPVAAFLVALISFQVFGVDLID